MTGAAWLDQFRTSLGALGVPPVEVDRLVEETASHATERAADPRQVFGPAISYARRVVDELNPAAPAPENPGGPVLVRLRRVVKRYRRRPVLDGVDLTMRGGRIVAVVGASGSGKSTLLRICAGLERADFGDVEVHGTVGYVPQHGGLVEHLTVDEHLTLFAGAGRGGRVRARATGRHLAARLAWTPPPRVTAGSLPGAARQKLSVVLGSLHAPEVLLFDEPHLGFDHESSHDFWQQVRSWRDDGRAVMVVTHRPDHLAEVDHVLDLGNPAGADR